MSKITFVVEESADGFSARAMGESIYTHALSKYELHDRVRDAVRCHFDDDKRPRLIHLRFVRTKARSKFRRRP